jgi:hypothetical protein
MGLARPPDRSLSPKSQTSLRMATISESDQFVSAALQAGRSHGYFGGLVLGDMRSIAPIMLLLWPDEVSRPFESWSSGAPELFDCLASLRPAERMQRELASSGADAEWSVAGAKLTSQSSGAGGTVPRR